VVNSKIIARMYEKEEILVAAKDLLPLKGVEVISPPSGVKYIHFMSYAHEIIYANGAAAGSLFLCPEAMKTIHKEAREEIGDIFPCLMKTQTKIFPAARLLVKGKRIRKLIERHIENDNPLFCATLCLLNLVFRTMFKIQCNGWLCRRSINLQNQLFLFGKRPCM
jgi:hypothetical protein